MARNSENIAGAISAVNEIVSAQTEALTQIKKNLAKKTTGTTDISLGITSAAVGDIVKVKAVDASGKPTQWEAESGSTLERVLYTTITSDVQAIELTEDDNGNPMDLESYILIIRFGNSGGTSGYNAYVYWVNGDTVGIKCSPAVDDSSAENTLIIESITPSKARSIFNKFTSIANYHITIPGVNFTSTNLSFVKIYTYNASNNIPIGTTIEVWKK